MTTKTIAKTVAVIGVGGALSLSSSVAHAQGWLADRKYSEGQGIRTGDFELHPSVGAEVGVDSNWFLRSPKTGFVNSEPTAPVKAAGIFRITPSLSLSTVGPQRKEGDTGAVELPKVTFRANLAGTFRAFAGDQEILDQNGVRNISANLNGRVDVMPQRPLSFGASFGYNRTVAPNTQGNPDISFNTNNLSAAADLTWTPGGGTLSYKAGYGITGNLLDSSGTNPFNNLNHQIFVKGDWKFTPKTSFMYDFSQSFFTYLQAAQAFNALTDSRPLRTRLGINGLVTPRFGFMLLGGWGSSFTNDALNPQIQQYDSFIGQAEARFFLTANPSGDNPNAVGLSISSLNVGYTRDFANSYLGTYYGSDRGYLKLSYFFAGRALVSLEGGAGAIEYPRIFVNPGPTLASDPFVNVRIDGTLFGEYRFSNSVGLNLTLKYTQEISDKTLPAGSGASGQYDMNYNRFEGYLGFRWFM